MSNKIRIAQAFAAEGSVVILRTGGNRYSVVFDGPETDIQTKKSYHIQDVELTNLPLSAALVVFSNLLTGLVESSESLFLVVDDAITTADVMYGNATLDSEGETLFDTDTFVK